MFGLKNNYPDEERSWVGIIVDTDFLLQIMYHTMLQATTVQMVFGCDIILYISFVSDG